jgi:hypothetical protein
MAFASWISDGEILNLQTNGAGRGMVPARRKGRVSKIGIKEKNGSEGTIHALPPEYVYPDIHYYSY